MKTYKPTKQVEDKLKKRSSSNKDYKIDNFRADYQKRQTLLGSYFRAKWDRFLPLDEMLSDRWKKAEFLQFRDGTSMYENVYVYGKPKIGKNVWIGPMVVLDATGGIAIGDYCELSCGVMIFTHSTHLCALTGNKNMKIIRPVTVGDHVYLGSGAIILPGVNIGSYSVIGAGAVVTHDIPPNSVAFGVPASVVGKVVTRAGKVSIRYSKRS